MNRLPDLPTLVALAFFGGVLSTVIVALVGIALVAHLKAPPNDDWWRDKGNWGG